MIKGQLFSDPNFEREVLEKLDFLSQMGYTLQKTRYDTEPTIYGPSISKEIIFSRPNRIIKIAVFGATYVVNISFRYDQKWFFFDDYMTSIHDDSLKKTYLDYFPHQDDLDACKKFVSDQLDLFKKHALTDLKGVLEGTEWIDVPHYLEGYN